ncbi:hypothetical protein CHLV4088_01180 [Campylobacter helveticus]|uniref:hypothetical protein n=1 Tax=Campylobacter helveticus TaxID=28898 RepID=UPI00214A1F6D|nr:hypothetical protein [Campylobacter helveticus]MCR2056031.1 hypothetical protein [Campylobacter helveticus]
MNAKVFSILMAVLVALVLALGGTYYYLFERDKNNATNATSPIPKQQQTLPQEPQKEQNLTQEVQETNATLNSIVPILPETNASNLQKQEPKKEELKIKKQEENKTLEKDLPKIAKKEEKKPKPVLKEEKKQEQKTPKQIRLSTIKEYQQKGKDSRFEPKLSSSTMKVYVMHGKALTQYRIELLEDMLIPVQARAQDYNLSVFIEMLPKHKMNVSIYNKDIIFSDKKKAYKYIDIKQLAPYLNNPAELNSKVRREEIIERLEFKSEEEIKGSDFARHIKSLKRGLETAQFFFPFTEIIEIKSQK